MPVDSDSSSTQKEMDEERDADDRQDRAASGPFVEDGRADQVLDFVIDVLAAMGMDCTVDLLENDPEDPPEEIRPGLSCTAKVTTATRQNVLTAPVQALTVRQKGDLENTSSTGAQRPAAPAGKSAKEEIQGVFVLAGDKAVFRRVETGITGATDVEILSGLNEGDEIVTGSFKVIRTLRNQARVKVENTARAKVEG